MLTYQMESAGNRNLYEYLYDCIREDLISGRIRGGEALPSKRALADHLGISVITVEHAYAQLQEEGYICAIPRRGFFAEELGSLPQAPFARGTGQDGDADGTGRHAYGEEQNSQEDAAGKSLLADFSGSGTPPEFFPFATWARLTRKILSERQQELMENAPPGGIFELREAIASYLREYRAMHVQPRQIVIGAGTEYLYGLLIQLLGFDKIYAVENPGYRKVAMVLHSHGVACRQIQMDRMGVMPGSLASSGADVLHVTPSHHFPTGITMPVSRRYELLGWAATREGRYIIEDDYDSELRMTGRVLPSLFETDGSGRVIYLNTFTKSLASTIRVSYMILPRPLVDRFEQDMGFYSCTVSTFEQYTLAAFIRGGHFERQISRVRVMSRRKRDSLLRAIRQSGLKEISSIAEEDSGLHFLLNLRIDTDGDTFLSDLERGGVRMRSLLPYFYGDTAYVPTGLHRGGDGRPDHMFIVNYPAVKEENIRAAVQVLERTALRYVPRNSERCMLQQSDLRE